MWLRDALPDDLPGARVLTYGYNSRLVGSRSFQNLEDLASKFRVSLRTALSDRPPDRPLIFIAHSLGGLVLKQALIQMASGDVVDRQNFQATYGILFFGVPNQGMDISSFLAMVGSQPNLPFLTMLSRDAGHLQGLIERFRTVFDFEDSQIISLFETQTSRTAREDAGKWSMSGDSAVLVDRFSAKSGRSWEESPSFVLPVDRNHWDMVKYSKYDDDGGIVGDFLIQFAKAAPAVIRQRMKSLESSMTPLPSNVRPLAFRSQVSGKQSQTKPPEKPVDDPQSLLKQAKTEPLERSSGSPQSLIKQAKTEPLERPVEASQALGEQAETECPELSAGKKNKKGKKLRRRTVSQTKEGQGPNDRPQESGSDAVIVAPRFASPIPPLVEKQEMPEPSTPWTRESENYLENFSNASFDNKVELWSKEDLTWAVRRGHISLVQYVLD